jgi:uncharacterized protein YxjI
VEIDINQRKLSIGFKYDIFRRGEQILSGKSELFQLLTHINLFQGDGGAPLLSLVQRLSLFRTSYDIQFPTGSISQFRTVSFWKGHYRCRYGKDLYDIFSHLGRKHSVYKNCIQVGWWDQEAVTWFNGDNYKLLANDNEHLELLVAFILILDDAKSNEGDRGMFSFNFGHIGPQARKFNPQWQPNMGHTSF